MMDIVFAQQLTNLRKQKGLSQQQLADKLYMTRQAVSKWELESRHLI
jgi:transcriptional regulator with XRE-family HTH domain